MSLHDITLLLQQRLAGENNICNSRNSRVLPRQKSIEENETSRTATTSSDNSLSSERILFEFMRLSGESITYIEARELWNDMRSTNNGELPKFRDSFLDCSCRSMRRLSATSTRQSAAVGDVEENWIENGSTVSSRSNDDNNNSDVIKKTNVAEELSKITLPDDEADMKLYASTLAIEIKRTYSIRLSTDKSELKFIVAALSLLWTAVMSVGIAGYYYPDNTKLGTFNSVIFVESFILFGAELIWECILSWVVLRYNIKINYTRKLGNLIKVPKYFVGDFLPYYTSNALSLTLSLAINQTLFGLIFYRRSREKFRACAYIFLSQDRREDRPDTLIFQVTEDIMRFAIYFPFKILVVDLVGSQGLIFIPIAINNIGDGLAEPVGVAFGKHKYKTTALYHKGRFFHSKFTRSYEGSSCVLITSFIVIAANYNAFNATQFWITFSILPFLMTLAEAFAPHTNDGPFLALVGCGFLTAVFLI